MSATGTHPSRAREADVSELHDHEVGEPDTLQGIGSMTPVRSSANRSGMTSFVGRGRHQQLHVSNFSRLESTQSRIKIDNEEGDSTLAVPFCPMIESTLFALRATMSHQTRGRGR